MKRLEKQINEDSSIDDGSSTSSDTSVNFLTYPKTLAAILPIPPLKGIESRDQSLHCKDAKRHSQTRRRTKITVLHEGGLTLQLDALLAK